MPFPIPTNTWSNPRLQILQHQPSTPQRGHVENQAISETAGPFELHGFLELCFPGTDRAGLWSIFDAKKKKKAFKTLCKAHLILGRLLRTPHRPHESAEARR
ncbi:hypothetical protein OE88DRAFT_1656264 [Heliocybe sulcata]|uniref:Uncharacterized protein n=1 Tax=Heliocybe sulcata TaxID=5364 RepID=A0A5C3N617_9AGAM|nr:hypothetical protein OE88DRAFT_1656264 [Heliocybe sulcata]